jgi:hypothetical protein
MNVVAGALNTYDALQQGDYLGAGLGIVGMGLSGVRGMTPSQTARLFGGYSTTVGRAAAWGQRGLHVVSAAQDGYQGYQKFQDGDYIGGVLDVAQAFANLYVAKQACFAAKTPLLTPDGHKFIECFRPGDQILTRAEDDPSAPVEVSTVEEVFVRASVLLDLHVGGQVIRTTAEHPFYVLGKGWTAAGEVRVGDQLSSHDGRWLRVEKLVATSAYEKVYNLRVAVFHTYFVGGADWGFSVWAHNAYNVQRTDYGSDELSSIALDGRRSGRLLRRQNAVVAEYMDDGGNLQRKLFKNVQADPQLGRRGLHAEEVMDAWFQKKGISPDQVNLIYSEYYPCSQGCRQLLRSEYSNAQVRWSFTYDQPGGPFTSLGRTFRARLFDSLGLP